MPQSNFDLRRKLLQLEALYDVGRALNTLRPEDELLEELMHRAVSVLDATVGFVTSLDEKLNVQNLYAFGIEPPSPPAALLAEPPLRQVLSSRQSLSVQVPKFLGGPGSDLLIAPMVAGDDIVGILGVGGKEERGAKSGSFLEDDLRFLESLASIGAAAIDNTRNYHRLTVIRESLEDENRNLKQRMLREYNDRLMVGDSPKMQRVIDLVARVADSQANVLIRGESGTGKEMVARLIHGNSPRRDGPFVAINCAALPETLLESELFGIERGVATGVEARPGRFEMAKGGTVFLDEIGDIPLTLQAKLLRVLQEREIEKLGGRRRIPIDVRILSATHRGLEDMIETGEFRQDLYYRLKVVEMRFAPPASDASILIVGGGPAGLECATTLARRGYAVTVAEAAGEFGGRLRFETRLPGLKTWGRVTDWRMGQLRERPNVSLYPGSALGVDDILGLEHRHVVIATGARWTKMLYSTLEFPVGELDGAAVYTPDDLAAGAVPQGPIVVFDFDNYYLGGAIAQQLALSGGDVTYVTPAGNASAWTFMTNELPLVHRALCQAGVPIHTLQRVTAFDGDAATLADVYSGLEKRLACRSLVLVGVRAPRDELYQALLAKGAELGRAGIAGVTRIGDAFAPGAIVHAVHSGHRYAREFDMAPAGAPYVRDYPV